MKTILDIFRWLFGLLLGFIMFMVVITMIPLAILGQQVLDKDSGIKWLTAFTNNVESMNSLREGILQAAADNYKQDDAATYAIFATAADSTTPLGKDIATIFSAQVLKQNIMENAGAFYSWLDGTTQTMNLRITPGGTVNDWKHAISQGFQVRYAALPACTTEQKKTIVTSKMDLLELPCSIGKVNSSVFDTAASKLINSYPEAKTISKEGIAFTPQGVTQNDRIGFLFFKRMSTFSLIVAWGILLLTTLFMVLLFTPKGVNQIMAGLIVGFTGMSLLGLSGSLALFKGVVGPNNGIVEVFQAFAATLGRPIMIHGAVISLFGLILVIMGIAQLAKPKQSIPAPTIEPAPVVKQETVVAKTETTPKKKKG